ncbi:unnamed protein product [Symbiodinium sp. KB8]|nr:unnamed protein product [Symbiodinium sp. KB8]
MAWDNKELHEKFEPLLRCLEEGSSVALLTMRGSCCPVTRAHCDMFQLARSVLLGQSLLCPPGTPPFSECLGLLALNPDRSIKRKFERRSESENPIRWFDRAHLIRLATAEVPWLVLNNLEAKEAVQELEEDTRWQHLKFVHFHLNGADDVARWEKWKHASHGCCIHCLLPSATSPLGGGNGQRRSWKARGNTACWTRRTFT